MYIGKSTSKGAMGARRDIGLHGANGKGSRSRTNQGGKAWQKNYDGIFRRKAVKPKRPDPVVRAVVKACLEEDEAALRKAWDRLV